MSVKKVLKAVKTLKEKGHPDYQFVSERNFKEECEKNDVEGFNLLNFNEAQKSDDKNLEEDYLDDMELDTDKEEDDKSHMTDYSDDESDREEEECRTKDPVQKWQFEYNKSTCYSNNYPEISYKDEINDAHNVAPGEGKTPINVLKEKDWDIKAFPTLHPDGKNGLHEEREENLTEQNYFIQRILNKDHRFANSPAYVFASTAYVEKKQMERNIGISGIRGKPKEGSDGSSTFTLDDPCNVLDSKKNTPRYWQKAKSELVARLENLGPFTFFFTLSSGDLRWPENFTSLLDDCIITYEKDSAGKEECFVDGILLKDYLEKHSSQNEFIRKNLLNATLTFQHRVKMFIKDIVMSKFNPMCINYNSYKVEFALRGAAHIHGVLWVDWEKCEAIPDEIVEDGGESAHSVVINHMERIKSVLKDIKNDHYEKGVTEEKLESLAKFADKFVTVSLMDPEIEEVVRLVNCHHHTKACRKYGHGCACRFKFPKFPSMKTIISVPDRLKFQDLEIKEKQKKTEELQTILRKVKSVLEDEKKMEELGEIGKDTIEEYKNKNKNKTEEELEECKRLRLEALLKEAKIEANSNGERIPIYEEALAVSRGGFGIVYKRDISETYVNTYNKEWLTAWDANMDLQLCFDFYAIITYISDYYTKDDF